MVSGTISSVGRKIFPAAEMGKNGVGQILAPACICCSQTFRVAPGIDLRLTPRRRFSSDPSAAGPLIPLIVPGTTCCPSFLQGALGNFVAQSSFGQNGRNPTGQVSDTTMPTQRSGSFNGRERDSQQDVGRFGGEQRPTTYNSNPGRLIDSSNSQTKDQVRRPST